MSGVNDKHLCRLLYAYELGMLEGEPLDEFEIHLLDCPRCQKEAGEFLPAAQLLKRDAEVRGLVEGLGFETPGPKSSRRYYFQTLVAIAAVVAFLVLKPWDIEFKPTQEIIAAENRLAVLYVGGISETEDDLALGHTLAGLLTADLSESNYIQVVSSQRLFDVARQFGLESSEQINVDNATAIAKEVGARWVLTVRLATDRSERRLVTQLLDVSSGALIASQSAGADTSASVFSLVDNLTVQLKTDLGLPPDALKEPDPKVAEVTSHSVKAYESYLKGVELANRYYLDEARDYFYKASKLDSTFAMAYYYLSMYDSPSYIEKAVQYSARATRKEQMYIMAQNALIKGDRLQSAKLLEALTTRYPDEKDAFYQLGRLSYSQFEFDKAIACYKKTLKLDPQHRRTLNQLAYAYDMIGRTEDALRTLDEYQRIAPDEANPWDSRGDILASNGRLDEAIAAYRRAVEIYPSFRQPAEKILYAYMHNGQYPEAEKELARWAEGCPVDSCSFVSWGRAHMLIYRGQYHDALQALDKAISVDEIKTKNWGGSSSLAPLHADKARLLLEMDSSAQDEIEKAIEIYSKYVQSDKTTYRVTLAQALIQAGKLQEAANVLAKLKSDIEATQSRLSLYWLGMGYLKLAEGDPDAAADCFERSANERYSRADFIPQYMLGRALLMAGQAERAATVLESRVNSFTETRMKECAASAKIHFYLAQAYEETGRLEKAIAQYESFLGIWENADSDLPELADAHQRLTRLKANP